MEDLQTYLHTCALYVTNNHELTYWEGAREWATMQFRIFVIEKFGLIKNDRSILRPSKYWTSKIIVATPLQFSTKQPASLCISYSKEK